jgi:hypothetical protein
MLKDNTTRLSSAAKTIIDLAMNSKGVTGVEISGSISVGFTASVRIS